MRRFTTETKPCTALAVRDEPAADADAPSDKQTRSPMRAFLGLSSEPVQVENITIDGITLRDSRRRRHQKTVIELVNTAGDFGCLVPMQVVRVTTHPEGGYMVVGTFIRKLTDKELRALLPVYAS